MLLKGTFEEWFADFLRFIYPDTDTLLEFSREFVFMDKELQEIIPRPERGRGRRIADLLFKTFLKDGSEKWILLHIEILGQERLMMARKRLERGYPHDKILSFLAFLKSFLYIDNQEINSKFDTIVEQLTKRETTMGVMDAIKQIAREEEKKKGFL